MPIYELNSGDIFDGKFRIEDELGQGGMAVVYRVTELGEVATEHALKLIRLPSFPTAAALAKAKERFRHEAAMQARIRHPHIVGVHRYDVASDGTPYLLMELLEGQDLGAVLKRVQILSWPRALQVIEQTGLALTALHTGGLIHRDLSPGNIFLLSQGAQAPEEAPFVKLLDFGIARGSSHGAVPVTDPNIRVGNPPYMAPECILKRPRPSTDAASGQPTTDGIDARADQFSLACILFELLAGYKAFLPDGSDPTRAFGLVLNYDPLTADLPAIFTPALRAVLARALSKDPTGRFATVAELVAALRVLDPEREDGNATVIIRRRAARGSAASDPHSSTAGGEQQAIEPRERLGRLIPSQRTLYWAGILTTVGILCLFAYRNELNGLWLSTDGPTLVATLPRLQPAGAPGLGTQRVPDLAAAPEQQDLLPPPPKEFTPPVVARFESPHPPKPPSSPKFTYSFSFESASEQERIRTAPILVFYQERLKKCLSSERNWKEVTVTFLTSYFISGLVEDQKQRVKRCLQSQMPPGKPLPRRTVVKRVIIHG